MYFITGENYPGNEVFQVHAYGEVPNFATKSIERVSIPMTSSGDVDTSKRGQYPVNFSGSFTDYFGETTDLGWSSLGVVAGGAGDGNSAAEKEAKREVESSNFWVKVADIYHEMKSGQVIEINPDNVNDGGALLNEEIPAGAWYDRLIKVTPGTNLDINPIFLDRIKQDKKGEMEVFLEGRTLTFNSQYFETNVMDPKGNFNLRMGVETNPEVSVLIPEEAASMQLHFDMNRSWQAEPYLTLPVNEALREAGEAGSDLYLFNYNQATQELELVGRMNPIGNGVYGIRVTGIYGDYVITADLPKGIEYRITEQTNTMDSKTYDAVANNLIDSGRSFPAGSGFNALATAPVKLDASITDGTNTSAQKSKFNLLWILVALLAAGGVTGGALYYNKKKKNDD